MLCKCCIFGLVYLEKVLFFSIGGLVDLGEEKKVFYLEKYKVYSDGVIIKM